MNWLRLAPLEVKKVADVPSGPTKENGPAALLLAATWNLTAVPVGVVAAYVSVVQVGVRPAAGFASFSDEVNVPEGAKPGLMYVTKLRSRPPTVVSAVQLVPLLADVTNWPLAYGFVLEKPVSRSCTCRRTCRSARLSPAEDEGITSARGQRRPGLRT